MNYVNHSLAVKNATQVVTGNTEKKAKKPRKQLKKLSRADAAQLYEALKARLVKNDEGLKYINDESDVTVAKLLDLSTITVQRHRREIFGELARNRSGNPSLVPYAVLATRVADLEERLARLERDLGVNTNK